MAFQVDGEYMGEVEEVSFRSVPRALRVVGLGPPIAAKRPHPGVAAEAGHRAHAVYVTDTTPKSLRTFAIASCG
jgi:hypothetical protein